MKNLIIIIGTIVLGVFIVSNFILSDSGPSLLKVSKDIMSEGTDAISRVDFSTPPLS